MTVQYIIIISIVAVCVGMAIYRICRTIAKPNSACDGCQLKDTCARQKKLQGHFEHKPINTLESGNECVKDKRRIFDK